MTVTARGAQAAGDHHLLTNGSYAVRISPVGAGGSLLGPWALTRWNPDPVTDAQGWFLYVRDAESSRLWSAGHQPVLHSPEHYEFRHAEDRATILRRDDGIETRTDIRVDPHLALEWRRYRFTNRSDRTRRLEVTSYVEVALNLPDADAGHPAFSKLFLETEHLPALDALLARRRPRSPDDPTLFMAHALMPPPGEPLDGLEFETDRARFIGRGRTTASPETLEHEAPLSGTAGPVLDPVLCIRRRLVLEPGETACLDGVLTAGTSREAVEQVLAAAGAAGAGDRIFAAEPEPAGPAWQLELPPPPRYVPAPGAHASDGDEPLLFFNGHGGFAESGEEYVIRADRTAEGVRLPPMPWCNVVANPHTGFVASERGLGFTWHGNSRENRLTPWLNDPVSDPAGEALYIRDEEAGVYWSPTPGPVPGEGGYEIRHGFGSTTWRHACRGLRQEVTAFVPRDEPVKIVRLRITNGDVTPRRLSVFFYAEWVLGSARLQHGRTVETEIAGDDGAVLARSTCKPDFGVALAAGIGPAGATFHATADREAFLGRWGGLDRPAALGGQDSLDGRSGAGLD
ncbi:MAG TPA: hypothetical protein VFN96_08920, partial [Gemmatimonadales bacterium]|nr:hypothetical protein [Gemmatimonadales bacterium]